MYAPARPQNDQRFLVFSRQRQPLDLDAQTFLLDCQARGLRPRTVQYYSTKLRLLQTYHKQHGLTEATAISPRLMRQYMTWVQESHKPGGSLLLFRVASRFFTWLVEEGELETSPMRDLKAPRVPERALEPVNLSDLKAMLATCQELTFTGDPVATDVLVSRNGTGRGTTESLYRLPDGRYRLYRGELVAAGWRVH